MEVHPGVFVSSISTNDWKPNPDIGGDMHILCSGVGVEAGLSRYLQGSDPIVRWTLRDRETLMVLGGAATVELADGPRLELSVGDVASLPKGAVTTWRLTLPYREFWVIG